MLVILNEVASVHVRNGSAERMVQIVSEDASTPVRKICAKNRVETLEKLGRISLTRHAQRQKVSRVVRAVDTGSEKLFDARSSVDTSNGKLAITLITSGEKHKRAQRKQLSKFMWTKPPV